MNGASSILVPLVLVSVSAGLGWLALRRGGVRAADACACGYPLSGNESGVCPECGLPADEGRRASERSRLAVAARRLGYWVLAVGLLGAVAVGLVVRLVGERAWVDCRVVLAPLERVYSQAEVLWRVEQDAAAVSGGVAAPPGRVARVEVRLTGAGGKVESREFTASTRGAVGDWVKERCATGPGEAAAAGASGEVAGIVERALGGAQVVLVGGLSANHTVLANGGVLTLERPRWATVLVLALLAGAAVWGGRTAVRRAMA